MPKVVRGGFGGFARSIGRVTRSAVPLGVPRRRADEGAVADLAELLSAAWRTPSGELVSAWREGVWQDDVRNVLRRLDPDADEAKAVPGQVSGGRPVAGPAAEYRAALTVLDRAAREATVEDVGAEYAALFTGPPTALVGFHECQWVDDVKASLFVAPSTTAVEAAYRQAGVVASTREPPDTLAAELEFVALLAVRETGASDPAIAHMARRQRQAFWQAHLGRWMEDVAVAVQRATEHGVYAGLGRLTSAVAKTGRLGD